jgi:hypothetical protein
MASVNDSDIGGFKALEDMLDSRKFMAAFMPVAERELRRTGMYLQVNARRLITAKVYAKNHPKTEKRKGSTTPLVDDNDLFGSINYDVKRDPRSILMVILGANKKSESGHNIARTLHEGTKDGSIPKRDFLGRALALPGSRRSFKLALGKSMKKTAETIKAAAAGR